jgi:hypothetical protein
MSGRRLWRRAHNTSGPSDGVGASITRRCGTSVGESARRRTPGRPGVGPSVAEGHARQQRWRGHPTDAHKAHERPAPAWRDGREPERTGAHRPWVWPASAGGAYRTLRFRATRHEGTTATTPNPREAKPRAASASSALHKHAGAARTARGDKAQEPRPVTRGRFGLASPQWVEGQRTTRRYIALNKRREAVIGKTAGGSGRRRRRATRGREQRREGPKPQERRRCSTCGVHRPGRATARAGSGTPAVKERRCMTRSNRCPTRDDRGRTVVAAGTGGKPQGRDDRPATRPERTACFDD